jgi:hypothetical protein
MDENYRREHCGTYLEFVSSLLKLKNYYVYVKTLIFSYKKFVKLTSANLSGVMLAPVGKIRIS